MPRRRAQTYYDEDLVGEGLLSNIYSKVTGRTPGERDISDLLKKHGQAHVTGLTIGRQVVQQIAQKLLNFVSLGKFQQAKESYEGYDKLFHLWLTVRLDDGYSFRIEKRPQPSVSSPIVNGDKELLTVDMNGKRPGLAEFIQNAQDTMGSNFYSYDPFQNNCQTFVENLLHANGLLSAKDRAFIQQDVGKTLAKELPGSTSKIATFVTDLASVLHDATGGIIGAGLYDHEDDETFNRRRAAYWKGRRLPRLAYPSLIGWFKTEEDLDHLPRDMQRMFPEEIERQRERIRNGEIELRVKNNFPAGPPAEPRSGRGVKKTIPLAKLLEQDGDGLFDMALSAAKSAARDAAKNAAKAAVSSGSDALGSHIGRAMGNAAGRRITEKYTTTGGHLIEHKGGSYRTRESKTHTQPVSVYLTDGQIMKLQGCSSASAGVSTVTINKPSGRTNSVLMLTKRDANRVSKAWAQGKGVRVSVLV